MQRCEFFSAGLATAVVIHPEPTGSPVLKTQHVQHADARNASSVEVGSLSHAGSDEQAAVASAVDGEIFRRRVFVVDQVLSRRDEVIEHILFLSFRAGFVPVFAVLATAAKVGHREDAAHFHPLKSLD